MSPIPSISLAPWTFIRASGPDAFRFLNGQLTNDLAGATTTASVHAAALNAKGGLVAVCWIRKMGDDFLLDAPRALRDDLMARLDRYLIADDLSLVDESDDWSLSHLLTDSAPADLPTDAIVSKCSRFGQAGLDIFSRAPLDLPDTLRLTAEQETELRVTQGIPAWGNELTPGMLPPEAGLESTAISYDKGCYLGQEVISRMKWAGKTNRHLVRLEVPKGTPVPCPFFHEGAEAGVITSVCAGSDGNPNHALGFRRRKFEAQESFTLDEGAGENDGAVKIKERLV